MNNEIDNLIIYEFMNSLTDDERRALELKLAGYKHREIAEEMGRGKNVITRIFGVIRDKANRWWN